MPFSIPEHIYKDLSMFFVFDISPTQRVMSLICFCCGLQELRIISKLDLLVNQLYIYIYIYMCVCVCVCVGGGGGGEHIIVMMEIIR